jgi:integrase
MKKLRRILNFNRALSGSSELPRWPAEELGPNGLKMWAEQKPRNRRVHREEFPLFWKALHELECPIQRDLFKFMLLIGCRSSEARNLRIEDINFLRKTVTFNKTKNGKNHTLPLTDTLHTLITERITESIDGLIFPLSEPKTVTKHIKRACGLHITPHDLRRTFAGVAEAAGVGSTTKKDLLNHLSGRDVTDDYTGFTDSNSLLDALEKIEKLTIKLSF